MGKRGLIHSTEKINNGKAHRGSRLVPQHQKHNSDGEGALDQALYSQPIMGYLDIARKSKKKNSRQMSVRLTNAHMSMA